MLKRRYHRTNKRKADRQLAFQERVETNTRLIYERMQKEQDPLHHGIDEEAMPLTELQQHYWMGKSQKSFKDIGDWMEEHAGQAGAKVCAHSIVDRDSL